MYCTQCGNPNPDGAKNCVACGAQLMGAAPTEPAPAEPEVVSQTNDYSQPAENYTYTSGNEYSAPAQETESASYSYEPSQQNTYQTEYTEQTTDYSAVPQELPGKKLGLASMILGIVSAVLSFISCCCCCANPMPTAIAALVTGILASKKAKEVGMKNTQATVGIIIGAITIGLSVISMIVSLVSGGLEGFMNGFEQGYNYGYNYYFISNLMM